MLALRHVSTFIDVVACLDVLSLDHRHTFATSIFFIHLSLAVSVHTLRYAQEGWSESVIEN